MKQVQFGQNLCSNKCPVMLIYVVIITMVFLIIAIIFEIKTKIWDSKLPGPTPLPFFGNALAVAGNSFDFFKAVNSFWDNYGVRFRGFIGNQFFLFLSDPKDVEVVLSSIQYIEKSTDYDFIHPWLGTGLLTSKGEKWKKHRKVITPTFHFKILEHFIQVFDSQSDVLLSKLKPQVDKGSFDIFPYITLCALDIISEAAMGVSIGAQNDSESEYVTAVKEICRVINGRQKNPIKRSDLMFMLSKDYWIQKKSLKILHGFTDKMIQERKKLLINKKESLSSYTADDFDQALGTKKKLAFLDMLLLSTIDGNPLSDIDIREEVDTFLFEGHDTTTSGISFALHLIAHYPDVQKKLVEEQKEIFGDDFERPATYNDLQNMKYMELAVKEALRIFPPVPIIARKINEDTVINDMHLEAGSTVIILVFNMNRNPDVFPEPLKFIPERFLLDEASKRSPYATVSFSAGPRNCIGQKFAMLEMKSTISKILRRYELLPSNEECALTADLILKSMNGVKIKLANRT